MPSARGWVLSTVVAYALGACGGSEFSAADDAASAATGTSATGTGGAGGNSGDVGTGGASGVGTGSSNSAVGSSSSVSSSGTQGPGGASGVGGAGGPSGGGAGTATGGTSSVPDASSDRGGIGGQPIGDASVAMDAQPTIDAARDALSDVNVVTKCPPSEPTAGIVCANGLECSYGTHPRPACRKLYVCSGSRFLTNGAPACPDPGNCLTEQPMAAQVGASCPTPQRDCTFSSGIYCRCLPDSAGGSATWDCYPSPTGCPVTPPNKGQVCDLSVPTCAYGTCRIDSKVTSSCVSGVVRWDIACPDAGPMN